MEAETIDLTDPLEDLLRQTGWTPEYLQERLVKLSEENTKNPNTSTKDLKDMTLSDLLGDYKCSRPEVSKGVVTETIELSDDEVTEVVTNKEDNEVQEITEVRVFEINDDNYDSECNEDDDDEFLEESVTGILHSNNENFYGNPSVLEDEHSDNNLTLNKNPTDNLDSLDFAESRKYAHLSKNRISETFNLPEKALHISTEENLKETCINTNINRKTPVIEDSSTNRKMSNEGDTLFVNKAQQQKLDNSNEPMKDNNLDENEIENKSDDIQKISENSLNLKIAKKVSKFFSCDSKSPSLGSYKSALSDTSECDKISTDLGFIISEVQGGINLIESSTKISNTATEKINTNYEGKSAKKIASNITEEFGNLPTVNEVIPDKLFLNTDKANIEEPGKLNVNRDKNIKTCNASRKLVDQNELKSNMATKTGNNLSSLINCDILSNEGCIENTKSIRKSIDEIIEQLDMACQEDSNTKNNAKQVEMNSKSNVIDDYLTIDNLDNRPSTKGSEPTEFFNRTLKTDRSTSLLLKSLDEAIKTCDKKSELSRKEQTDSSSRVGAQPCPHQTESDKMEDKGAFLTTIVAESSKTNKNLKINHDFAMTEGLNDNEDNHEFCTKTSNCSNNDNTTDDLIKSSIENEAEIKKKKTIESKTCRSEMPTDASFSVVSNNNEYLSDSIPVANDILQINMKNKYVNLDKDSNNYTLNEEPDNAVDSKIQNITSKTNINLQIKTIIDPLNETPIFESNSVNINSIVNKVIQNETCENSTNDNGENSEVEILYKKSPKITEDIDNLSRIEIFIDDSITIVNPADKTRILANITVEGTSTTKLQPNLDNNWALLQQSSVEGDSLDKNIEPYNSQTQKNLTDSIPLESEKAIHGVDRLPNLSKTVNSCDESNLKNYIFPVNENLIKTPGSNEKSKYNIKDDSEEDNFVEESQENFEEIRKNLKLQLTSLRNRKKMNILQDVKTKVMNIEFTKNPLSVDITSQDLYLIKPFDDLKKSSSKESNEKLNEILQPTKQDLVPSITHSVEEAKPVYLIEEPKTEKQEKPESIIEKPVSIIAKPVSIIAKPESIMEKPEDEDVPNVFNEIRKIIRKQRTAPKVSTLKSIHDSEGAEIKNVIYENHENDKTKYQKREKVDTIENNKDLQIVTSNNLKDKSASLSNAINSPFVSNSLDEFLTDAKLNVSYMIPKSGAEEGLRQNYSDEPIMPPVIAEIKEEDSEKSTHEIKYKPKTLAEKRRFLEKNKLKEKKRLEKLKKLAEAQKRSYVLFQDKKIFLKAKSMSKCIASIESSISVPRNENSQHITLKKPSLLTDLYKKVKTPVKYRPGPLCKKHLLQTDYSNWTTELQTLPKVTLKVMPQLGKPIHPNLLHILQQWDDEVTDDQIEFALSALVAKGEQKQNKVFKFDVPYESQQTQMLTRKRIFDKPTVKLERLAATKATCSTSEEDVAEVMEKLLDYVEIKEMAPTLIKYDKDFTTFDESPIEAGVPPLDNHVFVKRKSRFTKTDRELIRLNCKVVSVQVEENEPARQCSKSYCRLGCICKSLQCERIIGLHCQKVKCIFGCTCPKENDKIISYAEPTINLPAGTDLLSMDTVTRIEGEAKRNLAKVEKEFTQTVIHTNDKTIVVGFGNKPRRATKTPKKYTDFFDDEILKHEDKEPKKEKTIPLRECSVVLENWDFSDLLPYCLVHHLYKCLCRGRSIFSANIIPKQEMGELLKPKEEKHLLISAENNANILLRGNFSKNHYPKRTVEESFKDIIRQSAAFEKNHNSENNFEETLYSVTGRPLRKRKKIYEADFVFDVDASSPSHKLPETNTFDKTQISSVNEPADCSRTHEIPKKYYGKTRSFRYALIYNDFANNLTQADLLKALQQDNDDNISDSDSLKRTIIEERKKLLKETETEIRKKKRKQKIQVRKDEDITIKTTKKIVPIPKRERKGKVKSVFKGEIIVNDSEWLKKLGQNAKQSLEGYARILPWTALLSGFLSKSVNVYCITDMPLRLLLNVGPKLTGEKIRDVETFGQKILTAPLRANASWLLSQSENVREIIKWLLSGTLPSRYKTTSLSFLLVETLPNQFEVRGLCTQGENKQDIENNQTDLSEEGEVADQITEVKHKNMNNEIESLFITKGQFRLRELVEDGCDDDLTDNLYMWVGLPEVYKVAKWRVVFLNNDFAFLYFKNIKYSIKYTDLVKLTDMAKEETTTLVLRNIKIRRSYDHASFGLYISHTYTDRIFIGPYFINYDDDEVETLRYINQQLVSAESFNKMTGNSNYRCGHWMYERTYYHTPTVYMKDTIDLTNEKTLPKTVKSALKGSRQASLNTTASLTVINLTPPATAPSPPPLATSTKDNHIIYHNGMSIHIKNSKPRSPSEFNRFIITNIPHFGYLGAYQADSSSTLEVSWPFERKVLEFENADNARDFLQERFSQLLQPVPETFQIQVIVLIHLDLKEHKPINSDFLSGHCICGYFGTYNFREVSDAFCKEKLNISKEEITKLFAKRAHAYIRKKIEELAEIVGINQDDPINFNVPTILDKAKEEIKSQENNRRQQVSEIQAYELKVVAQMKKLYEMVNILPIKERNIESKIINEILQIRPKRLSINEVVEIKDDDDDDGPSPSIKLDPVIYNIESDDTNVPEQHIKAPLKRKKAKEKKVRNPKVAKVAPFTSVPYVGPSTSVSILKPRTITDLKAATTVIDVMKSKVKQGILIVRPNQTGMPPPIIFKNRESIPINEDTETLIINEDIETVTINDDIETFTINENIETVTINKDMETVLSEYQSEETDNLAHDDNVNHYIIEYEESDSNDQNVTEIIVSQPNTTENVDLSRATILASVPPASNTSDKNSVTVSIVTPAIPSSEIFSSTSSLKTYSKKSEPFTITSTSQKFNTTLDLDTKEEKYIRVSSAKELSGKIKLGLQNIIKKSEENLLFRNETEKQNY